MSNISKFLKSTKTQLVLILILILLAYLPKFQNQFVGDDQIWIRTWEDIRHIEKIPQFFLGFELNDARIRYRPVGSTFLTIYYQLFEDNAFGWHAAAFTAHLVSTLFVFLIARMVAVGGIRGVKGVGGIPFIAALIFGLHPVNVETVSVIVTSISLGFCFALASFFFYLRAGQHNSYNRYKNYNYYISIILAVFAFLSYELTVVLPLLILLYEYLFGGVRGVRSIRGIRPILSALPYFISAALILFIRTFVLGISENAHYLDDNFYLTMLVMLKVFFIYITLLIFPLHLTINRTILEGVQVWIDPFTNMESIRSLSIFNLEVVLGLAILIILLVLAIKSFKKRPLISFCIGWYLISLLPVSFIYPQGTIMQERYIYLGSFAYALFLSVILNSIQNPPHPNPLAQGERERERVTRSRNKFGMTVRKFGMTKGVIRMTVLIFTLCVLIFYGIRTYIRNLDWKDPITMWSKLSRELPNHVTTNYMLGGFLADENRVEEAISTYSHVLEIEPNAINVYQTLGKLYEKQGNNRAAIAVYNQALTIVANYEQAAKSLDGILKSIFNKEKGQYELDNDWIGKEFDGYLLFYPKNLTAKKSSQGVGFEDSNNKFFARFRFFDILETSPDEFLKSQTESFGTLINQGLAKVPNAREAYVKIWEDGSVQKLQFFLFKGKRAVEVLFYPQDSEQNPVFEEMIKLMVAL